MELKTFFHTRLKQIAQTCLLCSAFSATPVQALEKINLVSFEDPPYVFSQGRLKTGLTVTYIDELMWRSKIDYELSIMPAKRALLQTLKSSNTCVFPIERSQEREVKYSWISPISISRYAFFKSPKKILPPIRVLNDAKDYRIGTYLGSAMGEYLSSLGFSVDFASDNKANILKLNAGRIDLWAADTLNSKFIAKQANRDLPEPELVFFTTVKAIGCHPELDENIVKTLNRNLKQMYKDGTIDKLSRKYQSNM